jgi:hypothetical protein
LESVHEYERAGYRIIQNTHYVMGAELDVWSLPRRVPCKGGATRQMAAKRLKTSKDGRVSLVCQDQKTRRYHVRNELFPAVFPELARPRPQVECRQGHPLMEFDHEVLLAWMSPKPRVARWGTGNRICLACHDLPETFDAHTYSVAYGSSGVPSYSDIPAAPKLWDRDPRELEELEWLAHGFIITNSPW